MADATTRDAIIAEMAAARASEPADVATDAPAEVVEETAAQDEAVEVEASGDDTPDVDLTEPDGSDDEPDVDADDEDAVELKSDDPKVQKGLDNVRRAEKRMREAAARRDAEFQAERAKWQAEVDEVANVKGLLKRAKYDPVSLLKAAGVTADEFEAIAQSIYAESPALQADPKQKAAAMAKLKAREDADKYSELAKKQAALEAKIEQQAKDAEVARETQAYIAQINTAAASKHPLVARLLKDDPDDTHDALVKTYNTLGQKLNRAPKAAEVVAAFDKAQRARLTKLGIDPDVVAKVPAKKPGAPAVTAKPVSGKPAANDQKPTNGAKKLTPQEERESILAEMAAARAKQGAQA